MAMLSHGQHHEPPDPQIDAFAWRMIRRKARRLANWTGFTQSDRDDIEQDLFLAWLRSLRLFDPSKAHLNAFTTVVIERHLIGILRDRQLPKRDWRRKTRLDAGDGEEDHSITSDAHQRRTGRWQRSDAERAELALDVNAAITRLPADLREIAELLKRKSISEIAREDHISRTTIYRKLKLLRRYFALMKLHEYLYHQEEVHA